MPTRRTFLSSVATIPLLSFTVPIAAQSDEPIKVVATFSILGDMVKRIGGEHVDVTTLVGPDGDTHVYRPTPADARAVSEAQIVFVNGLEFEGWLDRLIDASEFDGVRVVATDGIEPLAFEHDEDGMHAEDDDHDDHDEHDEDDDHHDDDHDDHDEHDEHDEDGMHAEDDDHDDHDDHDEDDDHHDDDHDEHDEDGMHAEDDDHDDHDEHDEDDGHDDHHHGAFDPHAWQSLRNAIVYVNNIAAALSEADPENAGTYYGNREAYVAELEALDSEIRSIVAQLPEGSRTVVTSHDAFQYFGRDYGLAFIAPQGLSTESEASAQDVARLIQQIRDQNIRAVFIENIADHRLLERIAEETGAAIGGTLYPGALSDSDGPAPTYLDMMRHNATTIMQALTP